MPWGGVNIVRSQKGYKKFTQKNREEPGGGSESQSARLQDQVRGRFQPLDNWEGASATDTPRAQMPGRDGESERRLCRTVRWPRSTCAPALTGAAVSCPRCGPRPRGDARRGQPNWSASVGASPASTCAAACAPSAELIHFCHPRCIEPATPDSPAVFSTMPTSSPRRRFKKMIS